MPPPIAPSPQEPVDLGSIESRIKSISSEIVHLKNAQRNISLRLDNLQDSQQDLLNKLNAMKSENYIQEINSLKAEKQLLQTNSALFTGEDAPDSTPTPSSRTLLPPSSKNKRKAAVNDNTGGVARRIKTESPLLLPSDEINPGLVIDTPESNAVTKQPRGTDIGSSDKLNISIWLNPEDHELEIYEDEDEPTSEAWKKDGGRLREDWKKQLREFNKKSPEWYEKARTAGCVRSTLWNGGKCYLTVEDEGGYACKTCWNTGHFCVAWDEPEEAFWLRPQLPAARSKDKSNIGPFDLEMFNSKKTFTSRIDLPAYWNKEFTA